jgi:putative addiction module component (TIGR02574 family)
LLDSYCGTNANLEVETGDLARQGDNLPYANCCFVYCLDSTSNPVNDPPMSLATIRNEIEKLEPAERASLIDLLWESLDDDSVQEIETKWAAESEDRIDAFERGELSTVDGPSVLGELRSSLKK